MSKPRPTLLEQISNRCVHFNGIMNDACKAGVIYQQLMGGGPGWAAHMPCFKDEQSPVQCSQAKFPTPEEAAAEVEESDRQLEAVMKARTACAEDAARHGWGKGKVAGAAIIKCPICREGSLRYTVASVNGHIHGKCSTPDCVSWME